MDNVPVMLKLAEVSSKFNISLHHARSLVLQRKVKYIKSGKKYLVNAQSVIDYFNEGDNGE